HGGAGLRRDVTHRLHQRGGTVGRHRDSRAVQFGHQRDREGGHVDAAQHKWGRHRGLRNAFRAIRSRPRATRKAAARNAAKIGGAYFFSTVPPARSIRSIGSASCGGTAAAAFGASPLVVGGAAGVVSAASLASSDSTNWPSSFSETCCSILLPNWASLP